MTVHLTDIGLDPERLEELVAEGLIRAQSHDYMPIKIYNYTEKVQFNRWWNDYTLACRGLILDNDYHVVARPWKKFFNLGEGFAEFDWDSPVEVTDKMDGSLGILYVEDFGMHGSGLSIATRGSFNSDQALHGTRTFVKKRYWEGLNYDAVQEYTFLVEIIYPANRIVLNYGETDDLVMLGAVHKRHGYYLGPNEAAALLNWPGPVTQVFEYRTLQEAFSNNDRPNAEGYVVRSGNKMVKLKQADYVELHRIVTNLNERTVWEMLGSGQTVSQICEPLPDEFHTFVKETAEELYYQFNLREGEILKKYIGARMLTVAMQAVETEGVNRKTFAQNVKDDPDKKYMFLLLDKKPIDKLIWQELKPAVSKE